VFSAWFVGRETAIDGSAAALRRFANLVAVDPTATEMSAAELAKVSYGDLEAIGRVRHAEETMKWSSNKVLLEAAVDGANAAAGRYTAAALLPPTSKAVRDAAMTQEQVAIAANAGDIELAITGRSSATVVQAVVQTVPAQRAAVAKAPVVKVTPAAQPQRNNPKSAAPLPMPKARGARTGAAAQPARGSRGGQGNGNGHGKDNRGCFQCGQTGHIKRDCPSA
jgi:hypothetical protein